ncbi:MAG: phosphoglycerate kinase [Thermoanaerobaculia bacterium]|nr:phosphoglycerate kinase [Thermoanaerobaculia bacterium]
MTRRLATLEDLDLQNLGGRRVLVRVDFNVPLDGDRVVDDTRLVESLPTLRELSAAGLRVVLMSHCGRPSGEPDPRYSLRPAAERLAELLEAPVSFATDCVGPEAQSVISALGPGDFCVLENLRFHPGEKANDPEFAAQLAALGDLFVGDAFGAAHRAHASVVGVPELLEHRAAGRLMVAEVQALGRFLGGAESPFIAVIGGAKISGKIDVLQNLLSHVDGLVIGGGMANTFLAAQGVEMGSSLVEEDRIDLARELIERAAATGVALHLPSDLMVADDFAAPTEVRRVMVSEGVPAGWMALDIGPETGEEFASVIAGARSLFWNGPMGVFERPPFDAGTRAVGAAVGKCPGFTAIGGGETVAAAKLAGAVDTIDHVSTGGGASLELLAGRELPGVTVLEIDEEDPA